MQQFSFVVSCKWQNKLGGEVVRCDIVDDVWVSESTQLLLPLVGTHQKVLNLIVAVSSLIL